jgi:hypothetical protein
MRQEVLVGGSNLDDEIGQISGDGNEDGLELEYMCFR